MIVLGLTGSIATGKSTVARQFSRFGIPVLDSDRVVHEAMQKGGDAVALIQKEFPQAVKQGEVDRATLGKIVFADKVKLKRLESLLHPLVWKAQKEFIRQVRLQGRKAVLLDIPLLFETHAEKRCDYTIVTVAPDFIQERRALKRANMTRDKLKAILARQMGSHAKKKRADFIIHTGLGLQQSLKAVISIIAKIGL